MSETYVIYPSGREEPTLDPMARVRVFSTAGIPEDHVLTNASDKSELVSGEQALAAYEELLARHGRETKTIFALPGRLLDEERWSTILEIYDVVLKRQSKIRPGIKTGVQQVITSQSVAVQLAREELMGKIASLRAEVDIERLIEETASTITAITQGRFIPAVIKVLTEIRKRLGVVIITSDKTNEVQGRVAEKLGLVDGVFNPVEALADDKKLKKYLHQFGVSGEKKNGGKRKS